MKTLSLLFSFILFLPCFSSSQCLVSLPPPSCNETEPLVMEDETLNAGVNKWYYGATTTMNSLTLKGGVLIVCGNLTIDKFYMDSGTIYIRPGGRLVIGSGIGSGLVLKGNSSIYNYGTFEIQRNLSLENGYATASQPNRIINANRSSVFKMPNQYLVINNPYSWFVNNGEAECWGIITDAQASAGSVCLGKLSVTKMSILINKVADSYIVPDGNACVQVRQFSQFYNKLTSNTGLLACLGAGHTSDAGCILWGCQPNNWGAASVFTSCNNCDVLIALPIHFSNFTINTAARITTTLNWEMNSVVKNGFFTILRSTDGLNYNTIDSFWLQEENSHSFNSTDKNPLYGNNYYMIKYTNPTTGYITLSKTIMITSKKRNDLSVFPVPFDNNFFIKYVNKAPEKILLTDITGRDIRTHTVTNINNREIEVTLLDNLEPGVYILHILTNNKYLAQTIIKK